jgi:hypothetical protein
MFLRRAAAPDRSDSRTAPFVVGVPLVFPIAGCGKLFCSCCFPTAAPPIYFRSSHGRHVPGSRQQHVRRGLDAVRAQPVHRQTLQGGHAPHAPPPAVGLAAGVQAPLTIPDGRVRTQPVAARCKDETVRRRAPPSVSRAVVARPPLVMFRLTNVFSTPVWSPHRYCGMIPSFSPHHFQLRRRKPALELLPYFAPPPLAFDPVPPLSTLFFAASAPPHRKLAWPPPPWHAVP